MWTIAAGYLLGCALVHGFADARLCCSAPSSSVLSLLRLLPLLPRPFRARGQENTQPSCVLGIFGISHQTTEADLQEIFGKFGLVDRITIIYDKMSNVSRGFGFIYFKPTEQEGATKAKEAMSGTELHGRQIRVDYSLTHKPHDSTPGQYMGERPPARGGPSGRGGPPPSGYVPRDQRGEGPRD